MTRISQRSKPRGLASTTVFVVVALLVVVTVGAIMLRSGDDSSDEASSDLFVVQRGSFDITIPASGELAAQQQIEVRNRLENRAVVTEIVDEGIMVEEGELLVRFNDDDIRNQIEDAVDAVDSADNGLVNARAILEIRRETRDSELDKADLAIRLAELALLAWQEGEDVSMRKQLALARETAQKQYDRLDERFTESKRLLDQSFISRDEFKRDEIAMIEAKAKLEQAVLDIEVYEKYEYEQAKAEKESDLEQAREERLRVEQRFDAEVRSGESDVRSAEHQLESKRERLRQAEEQLEFCTLLAPSTGLVVYASSLQQGRGWRGDDQGPQVGSELSRNAMIIALPDTSRMIAEVKVNEALSGLIQPTQQATVISDAVPDAVLTGEVIGVGVLAESGGWRDPNRRDYTVRIALQDTESLGLKPSMRCKASIAVGRVKDTLYVPIQAVKRDGGDAFTYVKDGSRFARRPLAVGRASELYVEILSGLTEGDLVLLRQPDPQEIRREESSPAATEGEQMAVDEPPARAGFGDGGRPEGRGQRPRGEGGHGGRGGAAGG